MKKTIIIFSTLVFLVSCSSNYKIRVESPKTWYERNMQEVVNKTPTKTDDMPDVKGKLQNVKNSQNINSDDKPIKNINETKAYTEDNEFVKALKNSSQIKVLPKEEKTEKIEITDKPVIIDKPAFTEVEGKLLAYIYSQVTESKSIVDSLTLSQYEKVKNKIGREQFLALAAKYIRDKKVNNYNYTMNIIVNQIQGK